MAANGAYSSAEIQPARSHFQLGKRWLPLLLDFSESLLANTQGREMMRLLCGKLCNIVECDLVSISLPGQEGTPRIFSAAVNNPAIVLKEGDPIAGEAARSLASGEPVYLRDGGMNGAVPAEEFAAECHIPLSRSGSSIGLLSLFWKRDVFLAAEDLSVVSAMAPTITAVLERELAYDEIKTLKRQFTAEKLYLEDEVRCQSNFDGIIGRSEVLKKVLRQIEMVAQTDSTVLVCGETGTGKELVARAIHDSGSRSRGSFVKLNCAAIPTGLLESELFGHERGAFTGAITQRIGRFELATRGTIFLDEIGETPMEVQPKLLRVLQEREFERLGSSKTFSTDARLIVATNRDLSALVGEGKFRADLFYRLNVFPITVPALRHRREDIPLLVRHFVRSLARKMNKRIETISADTMQALIDYSWPGNIRELQNVLERAVILSSGQMLKIGALDISQGRAAASAGEIMSLNDAERKHIKLALEATKGVVAGPYGAAALLGLKRTTLQAKMQRLGVQRK